MVPGPRSDLLGTVLDERYAVLTAIGAGGSGAVFEVERLSDGGRFALKVLQRDAADHPDLVRRLRREADVGRTLHHAGIVRCLDEGSLDDGSPYLVMERLHGRSLAQLITRLGRLSIEQACAIGARVAGVLHAVHAQGYVHRDVKSEHIWLSRTERGLGVHLLDFGVCLAPDTDPSLLARERDRVFGTPGYMSPEQARGDGGIDGRSDLFSLGVVLFEALTGERPFQGPNAAVLLRRVLEDRAPQVSVLRKDVPSELARCVARLLERDPGTRPVNARSAERTLNTFVASPARAERALSAQLQQPDAPLVPMVSAFDAPTRDLSLPAFAARG